MGKLIKYCVIVYEDGMTPYQADEITTVYEHHWHVYQRIGI